MGSKKASRGCYFFFSTNKKNRQVRPDGPYYYGGIAGLVNHLYAEINSGILALYIGLRE